MEEAPPSIVEGNNINNEKEKILNIDSGEFDMLFYKWPDAKHMMNSKGDRTYSKYIYFKKKFETKPNVIVSLKGIDTGNYKNTRINLFAKNISKNGFILECLTWDDSITYGVYASWIAIGY